MSMLDDDHFLGAENSYNLFTVENNRTTEEATQRMGIGLILLGSLVMKMPEGEGDGLDLPTILLKVIHGVGGLSHAE